jgi:hypothetical protein
VSLTASVLFTAKDKNTLPAFIIKDASDEIPVGLLDGFHTAVINLAAKLLNF